MLIFVVGLLGLVITWALVLTPVLQRDEARKQRGDLEADEAPLAERLARLAEDGREIVRRLRDGERQLEPTAGAFEDWRAAVLVALRDAPVHLYGWFAERATPLMPPGPGGVPTAIMIDAEQLSIAMTSFVDFVATAAEIQRALETGATGRGATEILVHNELLALHHQGQVLWGKAASGSGAAEAPEWSQRADAWNHQVEWLARSALPLEKAEWLLAAEPADQEIDLTGPLEGLPPEKVRMVLARHPRLMQLHEDLKAGRWMVSPDLPADQLRP